MRIKLIAGFIKNNFMLFFDICIILSIICGCSWGADGNFHFAKIRFLTSFLGAICFASLFTWLCSLSKTLKVIIISFISLLLIIDLYLFFEFRARLTSKVMLIIGQTNYSEAYKFGQHYITEIRGIIAVIGGIIFILSIIFISNKLQPTLNRLLNKMSSQVIVIAASIINMLSVVVLYIGMFTSLFFYQISFNTVEHLIYSVKMYIEERPNTKLLEKTTQMANATIASEDAPDYIIWVIGESFNKHHSPLYGYPINTTPNLLELRNKGDLIVFEDAVTPSSSTIHVMDAIYSTHSINDSTEWAEYPLSVTLLHKAGYYVALYDNQTTKIGEDLKHDMTNMWFFNSNTIADASLDYRNEALEKFDLDFCTSEMSCIIMHPRSIYIFHINGQHIPAKSEYPQDFNGFDVSDYGYRKDLSVSQKEDVAYYDTATLYNDEVLKSIIEKFADKDAIVIYHSDHGEEIHDYRDNYGRNFEAVNKNIARNIFEVPMMVYTSKTFRDKHPTMYLSLQKAADKPFYLKNISHFILDISGIESEWYKPYLSPLNDNYICGPRIINDEADYDYLMNN